jgi:hypothetical protein
LTFITLIQNKYTKTDRSTAAFGISTIPEFAEVNPRGRIAMI